MFVYIDSVQIFGGKNESIKKKMEDKINKESRSEQHRYDFS